MCNIACGNHVSYLHVCRIGDKYGDCVCMYLYEAWCVCIHVRVCEYAHTHTHTHIIYIFFPSESLPHTRDYFKNLHVVQECHANTKAWLITCLFPIDLDSSTEMYRSKCWTHTHTPRLGTPVLGWNPRTRLSAWSWEPGIRPLHTAGDVDLSQQKGYFSLRNENKKPTTWRHCLNQRQALFGKSTHARTHARAYRCVWNDVCRRVNYQCW